MCRSHVSITILYECNNKVLFDQLILIFLELIKTSLQFIFQKTYFIGSLV